MKTTKALEQPVVLSGRVQRGSGRWAFNYLGWHARLRRVRVGVRMLRGKGAKDPSTGKGPARPVDSSATFQKMPVMIPSRSLPACPVLLACRQWQGCSVLKCCC